MFDKGLYLFSFICPIFFIPGWETNMAQGIFFVFGVFGLLALSFMCKRQREYKNIYLSLIVLWSLMGVFIHSFVMSDNKSFISKFINFSLMSEGFIFVLCGAILFYLVVSYSKNFKIVYPVLAICVLNLFFALGQRMGYDLIWQHTQLVTGRTIYGMMGTQSQLALFSAMSIPIIWASTNIKSLIIIPIINLCLGNIITGVITLISAIFVYSLLKKRFKIAELMFLFGLTGLLLRKFIPYPTPATPDILRHSLARLDLWWLTFKEIIIHPFLGWGFSNSITGNFIYCKTAGGLSFRHNDFLNITKDLGIPFLVIGLLFLWSALKNAKKDYLLLSIIITGVTCFYQTNLYFVRIAVLAIIILGLIQTNKGVKDARGF